MISRKSAKLIGEIYTNRFSTMPLISKQLIVYASIYTFFYEENYETWFLNIVTNWIQNKISPLGEIMRIHTGETLIPATKDWTWEKRTELGQTLLKKLAEDIINVYEDLEPVIHPISDPSNDLIVRMATGMNETNRKPFQIISTLKRQLEIDGYIFQDGTLYFNESSVIKEKEEQTILELLINKLPLNDKPIIINHLKLSEEHYLNGKWGDSISNSRNFLEAILEKIAHSIYSKKNLTTKMPDRPVVVRDFLEKEGFINSTEKEAINKTYGLISNTGSHPNMAEQDEARLMRHLALTFSQYLLLNYESFVKNNP